MLNELSAEVHSIAKEKGWWDDPKPTLGETIALCHAELSEALEEYRKDNPFLYYPCNSGKICCEEDGSASCGSRPYNPKMPDAPCSAKSNKPEGIAVELADCIIRILDYCGYAGIDIDSIIREKIEYNKTRPYRHGGKRL